MVAAHVATDVASLASTFVLGTRLLAPPLASPSMYKLQPPARPAMSTSSILLSAKDAKKQYVGETQNPLHIHLNGHCSDIKNNRTEKPVAAHFNILGHSLSDLTTREAGTLTSGRIGKATGSTT